MTEQAKSTSHIYLKDRMRGRGGWLKFTITSIWVVVMLGMLATQML